MPTHALKPTFWKLPHALLPLTKPRKYSVLRYFFGRGYFDRTLLQNNKDMPA